MNNITLQIALKTAAMALVLLAVPAEFRDWSMWTLIGLILAIELILPLDRYILRRFPNNRIYNPDNPAETANIYKTIILLAEVAMCAAIYFRATGGIS